MEHMFHTPAYLENVGSLRREFGHGDADSVSEVKPRMYLDTPSWQDSADGQQKLDKDLPGEDVDKFEQPRMIQHPEQLNRDQMDLWTQLTFRIHQLSLKEIKVWQWIGQAGISGQHGELFSAIMKQWCEEYCDDYISDGFTPTRKP